MTDRYPEDLAETPGPLDPIVEVLREADVSHHEKAIALVAAAATEYRYAVEDGEVEDVNFLDWSRETLRDLDVVLDRMGVGR